MNTPGGRSLDCPAAPQATATRIRLSRNVRYIRMLFLGNGLEISETGGEIVADHLVDIHEDAHHLEDVGRGTVHSPGDFRVVTLRVHGEFGSVVTLERFQ